MMEAFNPTCYCAECGRALTHRTEKADEDGNVMGICKYCLRGEPAHENNIEGYKEYDY